jgi:hypothetical protein
MNDSGHPISVRMPAPLYTMPPCEWMCGGSFMQVVADTEPRWWSRAWCASYAHMVRIYTSSSSDKCACIAYLSFEDHQRALDCPRYAGIEAVAGAHVDRPTHDCLSGAAMPQHGHAIDSREGFLQPQPGACVPRRLAR